MTNSAAARRNVALGRSGGRECPLRLLSDAKPTSTSAADQAIDAQRRQDAPHSRHKITGSPALPVAKAAPLCGELHTVVRPDAAQHSALLSDD
jgi:hypothetical protein